MWIEKAPQIVVGFSMSLFTSDHTYQYADHTQCGMWEDAGFSDFRCEYSSAGSGGVTFSLPGSVTDPFLVQSRILQAITMPNQQVCVT